MASQRPACLYSKTLFCCFSIPKLLRKSSHFNRRGWELGEKPGDEMRELIQHFFSPYLSGGMIGGRSRSGCRSRGGGKGPAPSDQAEAPLSLVQQPLSPAWSPGGRKCKARSAQCRRRRSSA